MKNTWIGILLAAALLLPQVAGAQEITFADETFTVSGEAQGNVTLVVMNPDGESIYYGEQTGKYQFMIPMDLASDMAGSYTFRLNDGVLSEQNMYYADQAARAQALEQVNAADTAEKMAGAVTAQWQNLLLPKNDYENLTYGSEIYGILVTGRPFGDGALFRTAFGQATALAGINHATAAQVPELLKQPLWELETGEDSAYAKLADSWRDAFCAAFIKHAPFQNTQEVQEAFKQELCLPYINSAAWFDIPDALKMYETRLEISFEQQISPLTDAEKPVLYKYLAEINFTGTEHVKSEFTAKIKSILDARGGSGGGGGGSHASGNNSSGNITVGGEFTKPDIEFPAEEAQPLFSDLGSVEWAKESIEALAEKGIVNGKQEGVFAPEDPVTREEFLKILIGALALDITEAELPFTDVARGGWYEPYVKTAYALNITGGVSDSKFGTGERITRQDMAVFAYRALTASGKTLDKTVQKPKFADADEISDYAVEAIAAMVEAGVLNGVGNGHFGPSQPANRAQAAKMIYELIK